MAGSEGQQDPGGKVKGSFHFDVHISAKIQKNFASCDKSGLGRGNFQDNILRPGTDAEFAAPDTEAGGNVIPRRTPLMGAIGLLVHHIRDPVAGPDLPVMRVPAELEVDAASFGFFQMIGLMVQQDGEEGIVDGEGIQRFPVPVGPVVAADDPDSFRRDG